MAVASQDVDVAPVDGILTEFEASRAQQGRRIEAEDLIPLLQEVQQAYGYLPLPVLAHLSRRTGIPTSRIYGVVTFYNQFYMKPHGKHTVTMCRGTSCHVRGAKKAIEIVKSLLGVEDGETTPDMLFSLETVACLGACAVSPVMIVDGKYYGKLTPRGTERITRQMMREEGR